MMLGAIIAVTCAGIPLGIFVKVVLYRRLAAIVIV